MNKQPAMAHPAAVTGPEGAEPEFFRPVPEFFRPFKVDGLAVSVPFEVTIEAGAEECRALARRFGLRAIEGLRAGVRMTRTLDGRMVRVDGRLSATVVQTCVVTLEPVRNQVNEDFSAVFAPAPLTRALAAELDLDPDAAEEDDPELLEDGRIDIGELTAQYLSLGLDPYPRQPGAEVVLAEDTLQTREEPAARPFARLRQLIGTDGGPPDAEPDESPE